MFRNYLLVTLRNLYKNKIYALINILGLGLALAICIVAYFNHMFGYDFDRYNENFKEIYRVTSNRQMQDRDQEFGIIPAPLGPEIMKELPSVELAARLMTSYSPVKVGIDKMFATERRTSQILLVFSILSIFITCLGLLGLISYTTNQRTREIGIRKIMGASVKVVMRLLSKEVLNLLAISGLISIPAYFGAKAWLQKFAYHIHFQAGVFFLVLLVVLLLSLAAVSVHSYRAATANPAESIRNE